MRDRRKGLERVRDGSRKAAGETLGKERQSKSSSVMLSAVCQHVKQISNFAGSWGLANDIAQLREHV